MSTIAVYDTYCGSANSGDAIIMDSVRRELTELFPLAHQISYPTHLPLAAAALSQVADSELCFVGGTNLIRPTIRIRARKNQWSIGLLESWKLKRRCILMGCGARAYQPELDLWARTFYSRVLSKDYLHAVRDSYSEQMLRRAGIRNVVNTGCPTLWEFSRDRCASIPDGKATDALFTLTDYCRLAEADKVLLEVLLASYRKLHFWIQGTDDLAYLRSIAGPEAMSRIQLIGPSLQQYDQFLESAVSLDYVGTRLHAGIRAMQKGHRAIIIGIDNRGIEMKADFGLNVLERSHLGELPAMINGVVATRIQIATQTIADWKAQFTGANGPACSRGSPGLGSAARAAQ